MDLEGGSDICIIPISIIPIITPILLLSSHLETMSCSIIAQQSKWGCPIRSFCKKPCLLPPLRGLLSQNSALYMQLSYVNSGTIFSAVVNSHVFITCLDFAVFLLSLSHHGKLSYVYLFIYSFGWGLGS